MIIIIKNEQIGLQGVNFIKSTGKMKGIINTNGRVSFSMVFLIAAFSILNSCQKMSDMNIPGGDPGGSKGPGANEVFIQNMAYSPSTITVAVNTTITWTNKDAVPHTVTSDSGVFDSGTISTNGTFSFTFTSAGTYSYHCVIHPSMTATVKVN